MGGLLGLLAVGLLADGTAARGGTASAGAGGRGGPGASPGCWPRRACGPTSRSSCRRSCSARRTLALFGFCRVADPGAAGSLLRSSCCGLASWLRRWPRSKRSGKSRPWPKRWPRRTKGCHPWSKRLPCRARRARLQVHRGQLRVDRPCRPQVALDQVHRESPAAERSVPPPIARPSGRSPPPAAPCIAAGAAQGQVRRETAFFGRPSQGATCCSTAACSRPR